jgi:hypothetical protein
MRVDTFKTVILILIFNRSRGLQMVSFLQDLQLCSLMIQQIKKMFVCVCVCLSVCVLKK